MSGVTTRGNALLDALPPEEFQRFEPHLQTVMLEVDQQVWRGGRNGNHVYFPTSSLVTLLCSAPGGESIAVAMIGAEGMIGFGVTRSPVWEAGLAVVQNGGEALRVPVPVMLEEFARGGRMQSLLVRHGEVLMAQMAQTALCNRLHSVDQQICRWILMSLDRYSAARLSITQQQLAAMLGVRRERVQAAIGRLQAVGALQWGRGRLHATDRQALQAHTCECYRVLKNGGSAPLPEATPSAK